MKREISYSFASHAISSGTRDLTVVFGSRKRRYNQGTMENDKENPQDEEMRFCTNCGIDLVDNEIELCEGCENDPNLS